MAKKSEYLNERRRNKNTVKENTLYAGRDVQIYIMKKKVDEFFDLHSEQIVDEEALSHQKVHFCNTSEEVKITTEKRVA